jgi:hypothetical protein
VSDEQGVKASPPQGTFPSRLQHAHVEVQGSSRTAERTRHSGRPPGPSGCRAPFPETLQRGLDADRDVPTCRALPARGPRVGRMVAEDDRRLSEGPACSRPTRQRGVCGTCQRDDGYAQRVLDCHELAHDVREARGERPHAVVSSGTLVHVRRTPWILSSRRNRRTTMGDTPGGRRAGTMGPGLTGVGRRNALTGDHLVKPRDHVGRLHTEDQTRLVSAALPDVDPIVVHGGIHDRPFLTAPST